MAKISSQLNLTEARVSGKLNLYSAVIGQDLFLWRGRFVGPIDIHFADIDGSLDLREATLGNVDLTGTKIEDELRIAGRTREEVERTPEEVERTPKWEETAHLVLRNVQTDAIQDSLAEGVWPKKIELDGFKYGRFGGFGAHCEPERKSVWYEQWLEKDEPYTTPPYQQCASVLREMGQPSMANDVLYAGRERARKESHGGRRLGLELLKWTIGYGYGHRYFWSLAWVWSLILVGALVLIFVGGADAVLSYPFRAGASVGQITSQLIELMSYSLDVLLPIIRLHDPHYDVVLDGISRYYFFFHKTMGYVLASFLVAGLSGLTK